ncbi:MAG: metalloregulator ArsR/SmtB family transcription factor [Acidimicrobiia bacterium]|nr:MAG: metalloregulator ArsR/SmtB family transcription factor [Acidimicrobiia bacterium]
MSKTRQIECLCSTETACCVALRSEPIDEETGTNLSTGFKALGDPNRVAVVHLLSAAPGPVCLVDIERHLPLSQSTVSYHLKTLVDAGVLDRERRGRWSYYTIRPERLAELSQALDRYRSVLAAARPELQPA